MIELIGTYKDPEDGTIKNVFKKEKDIIEISVLYNKFDRDVICVPTHHYCSLGCKICHLTKEGFKKPMKRIELEDLLYCIKETLIKYKRNKKKLLVSFMGVGDPLLNIDLITDLYKNEEKLKNIGYDYIGYSLATMMPNDNINKLGDIVNELNMPLKIHFSLHTPTNKKRLELIPSTKIDVDGALELLNNYQNKMLKNDNILKKYNIFHSANSFVELHYTLIKDVNDTLKELTELIEYLKEYKFTIKFLKFNDKDTMSRSKNEDLWYEAIRNNLPDINIKRYTSPGKNIGASCGKFTEHFYLSEIETAEEYRKFKEWESKYRIYV